MAFGGPVTFGAAADAVGVVLLAHDLKIAVGGGRELGVGAVREEIAIFGIIAGDQGGGNVRTGDTDLAALGQAGSINGFLGGQVYIVGAGRAGVAGDVGDTADGEGGAVKVHAAAQLLGGVAGDGGAAEVQDNIAGVFAGLAIDGAAVTVGGVVLDDAVLNVHGHPAIGVDSAALRVVGVGAGGGAAGDGGALHGEGGGILVPGPIRLAVDINSTTLGGVSAVFNSAALLHDHTAQYQADGTAAVDGRTVLDGGALAQGQLGLRVVHAEKSVFCLSGLFVAVQNNVPEGQISAVVQFKSVIRIVRCGRK